MKLHHFIFGFCLSALLMATSCDQVDGPIAFVIGIVQNTSDYCGGAAPTPEILEELATLKPLPNTTFFVRAGLINDVNAPVVNQFTTDENGLFGLVLPPGDYVAVRSDKLSIPLGPFADSPQCEQWIASPDISFHVVETNNLDPVLYNIHFSCNTCFPPPP